VNVGIIVVIAVVVLLLAGIVCYVVLRRKNGKIDPKVFANKWMEIQRLCAKKETWALAVINADKLLDTALKQKRIKGKSMGERMVSAQRTFTNNDSVWYAHNLAKKLLADSHATLRQAECKKSLVGIRQALRDLEVLNGK
jgi:hypothetical protein